MRITCPNCGSKAAITHSRTVTKKVKDFYIMCSNDDCSARSLMTLTYQYDLTPPKKKLESAVENIIADMSPRDRYRIISKFQRNTVKINNLKRNFQS